MLRHVKSFYIIYLNCVRTSGVLYLVLPGHTSLAGSAPALCVARHIGTHPVEVKHSRCADRRFSSILRTPCCDSTGAGPKTRLHSPRPRAYVCVVRADRGRNISISSA
jgi:hypothetical protein